MPAPDSGDVLEKVLARASRDEATLGVLLKGSHAFDAADDESDYDLIWVLTDAERERRRAEGESLHVKERCDGALLDIVYSSPASLGEAADEPGWWSPGLAYSRVLLDKTGEVGERQRALASMTEERARGQAAECFDAYLNSFYRSMKAWRRGDELAGRIEAAESVMHLVRTLFSLERRWAPYPNRLRAELPRLDVQGWPAGYLERVLLAVVSTGDPQLQQELEERAEAALRERGFGHVVESWDGEIERVKSFGF